jgi:hypothetical protein
LILDFLHFQQKYPEICNTSSKSTENSNKKTVWPSDNFLGLALYLYESKFSSTIWTSWVSKDAELYADLKNINLPYWQNAPKRYSRIKNFFTAQGAPCVQTKSFSWNIFFWVFFVTKKSFYFLNLHKILRLLRDERTWKYVNRHKKVILLKIKIIKSCSRLKSMYDALMLCCVAYIVWHTINLYV